MGSRTPGMKTSLTSLTDPPQKAGPDAVTDEAVPALSADAPVATGGRCTLLQRLPGAEGGNTHSPLCLGQAPQVSATPVYEEVPHTAHIASPKRRRPHLRGQGHFHSPPLRETAQVQLALQVQNLALPGGQERSAAAVHRDGAWGSKQTEPQWGRPGGGRHTRERMADLAAGPLHPTPCSSPGREAQPHSSAQVLSEEVLPSSGAHLSQPQPQPSRRVRSRLLLPHLSKSSEDAQEGRGHTPKGLDGSQLILPSSPLNQQLEAQSPKEAERVEPKGVPHQRLLSIRSICQAFSTSLTSLKSHSHPMQWVLHDPTLKWQTSLRDTGEPAQRTIAGEEQRQSTLPGHDSLPGAHFSAPGLEPLCGWWTGWAGRSAAGACEAGWQPGEGGRHGAWELQ